MNFVVSRRRPTSEYSFANCGDISSSVLNQRLGELRHAGIVEAGDDGGFRLTDEGRRLLEAYRPLDAWARRWAKRTR